MNTMKQIVEKFLPARTCSLLGEGYRYWRREAKKAKRYFNPKYWISTRRIRVFKNKHAGERCFIIGNGPSLNKMDLSLLHQEITFGLNRIYLLFSKMGFHTSYYVCVNRLVIEQCAQDIAGLFIPKFLSWHAKKVIHFTPNMMFIRDPYNGSFSFSKRPNYCIWEGATVTYAAMQLAYYMGFRQVILIGVDHSYATKGKPHKTVVSTGADPNHFDSNYFGRGFSWQLPDLETSEKAYQLAKQYFEQDGREILDATVDGKLKVFPKVDYRTLF